MFEGLFTYSKVLARHQQGPEVSKRARYLRRLSACAANREREEGQGEDAKKRHEAHRRRIHSHVNEAQGVVMHATKNSSISANRVALWRRLDRPGHDLCRLTSSSKGWRLDGVAVFLDETGPAAIEYSIRCDLIWTTLGGTIRGVFGGREIEHEIARASSGWTLDGRSVPGLGHLVDLDLSFTPATNLIQLRRVPIKLGERIDLPAAWFDLATAELAELPQTYQRRSPRSYWYEAPSVGYEGLLTLDAGGFVRRYPGLWEAEVRNLNRVARRPDQSKSVGREGSRRCANMRSSCRVSTRAVDRSVGRLSSANQPTAEVSCAVAGSPP